MLSDKLKQGNRQLSGHERTSNPRQYLLPALCYMQGVSVGFRVKRLQGSFKLKIKTSLDSVALTSLLQEFYRSYIAE